MVPISMDLAFNFMTWGLTFFMIAFRAKQLGKAPMKAMPSLSIHSFIHPSIKKCL